MGPYNSEDEFSFWMSVLLFFTYVAFDFLYAIYYIFVSKKQAVYAATTAVVMYLLSAFATVTYLKSFYYVISIVLGSFVGTYIAVKYFSDKVKE
jgi:uncharacterized membrane protein YfcA